MQLNTLDFLLKAAQSSNANIRKAAAIALAQEDSTHAKSAIIKLVKDSVWQVRESAISSIGVANITEADDLLMKVLGCDSPESGRKAVLTWAVAKGEPAEEKGGAKKGASPFGGGAPKDKKSAGDPWQVKKAAALSLSKIRPDIAAQPLLEVLNSDNPTAKSAAMVGLGNIKAEASIDALIELLSDDDWNVRKMSANTLGRLKAANATDGLLKLLDDEKSAVRNEAVIALNHIKPPEALNALAKVVTSDNSYDVRKTAATALGNLRDPEAATPLFNALGDENWMVRKAAVDALINIREPAAVEKLIPLLMDEHEDVSHVAAVGVIRLSQI